MAQSSLQPRRAACRVVAWLLPPLLALPAPLLAQTRPSNVVFAAAQKEFGAGHFERAGELFLEVWQQGKAERPALYNAARAFHLAGKLDKAEALYREFQALPDQDAAVAAKIPAFLEAVLRGCESIDSSL